MDRGYLNYVRLYCLSKAAAFFGAKAKSNLKCRRVYSHPVDRNTGLICDQSVLLTVPKSSVDYPGKLRRVKYYDSDTKKTPVFLTNNFTLPSLTICMLYRCRWQVELFFKWIKQNLRIKTFYGTSENAVKTQIWIAVSVYVLVAIMKKQLNIRASLYTILQVLIVSAFKRPVLFQLLAQPDYKNQNIESDNQLDYLTKHWHTSSLFYKIQSQLRLFLVGKTLGFNLGLRWPPESGGERQTEYTVANSGKTNRQADDDKTDTIAPLFGQFRGRAIVLPTRSTDRPTAMLIQSDSINCNNQTIIY